MRQPRQNLHHRPLPHPPSLPPSSSRLLSPPLPHTRATQPNPTPSFLLPLLFQPHASTTTITITPPTPAVHTSRPPRNVGPRCTFEAAAPFNSHRVWGNHNIHNSTNCQKKKISLCDAQRCATINAILTGKNLPHFAETPCVCTRKMKQPPRKVVGMGALSWLVGSPGRRGSLE